MRTLLEIYDRMPALGGREAILRSDGHRRRRWSYRDLHQAARAFAERFQAEGVRPGDRIVLWSENRPEWAAAFWGCLLIGAAAVPVDFRSSAGLARRIAREVEARLILVGQEVAPEEVGDVPRIRLQSLPTTPQEPLAPRAAEPDDVVEIVYTSGSTSAPRGVVHRHRNLCANLRGVAREIDRHRWLARPFQPLRMLDLLPLSHLFGQTLGLYMPVLLGGSAVFSTELNPVRLIDLLRRERISVLTAVPGVLATLRAEVEKRMRRPVRPARRRGWLAIPETWWRQRDVHSRLGWKFWAFVVGGATLDEHLESFWRSAGYAVVQGYGLTESSPVVTLNHPFSARRGSIGRAAPGQQIRLGPDGEILVRGESVAAYYAEQPADGTSTYVADGWLHTGDLGEIDSEGRLYYRGRKKDLIVRPDGLNVFPADVERALSPQSEVAECAVLETNGKIHAAIVPSEGRESAVEEAERRANETLEPYQRIQDWSVWRSADLPRTSSTWKIRRGELALLIERRRGEAAPPAAKKPIEELLGRSLSGDAASARLAEDFGLSSLDRVELLARVEDRLGREVDEAAFAGVATVGDLERFLSSPPQQTAERHWPDPVVRPRWNRWTACRWARSAIHEALFFPLSNRIMRVKTAGLEALDDLEPPALFAANHASHFDTLAILRALPRRLRSRIAPAMSQDFFGAFFRLRPADWPERLWEAWQFFAALAFFQAYPLPQKMAGARRALQYTGELLNAGRCPLVYPEGVRTRTGDIGPFQPGIGLLARELEAKVVPVRLDGLFQIYSVHDRLPRPGVACVCFGRPLDLSGEATAESAARRVENAVRKLSICNENETLS